MRRGALALALALVPAGVAPAAAAPVPWRAAEVAALRTGVDALLTGAPELRAAHAGLLVVDAAGGRVLYARNADQAFQPASTLKLLTGAAALDVLGPGQRFRTEAFVDGALEGGVLRGSLIVRAGGDPFLGAAEFDALAAAVAARGIARIDGEIAFDVSRYEPDGYAPGWSVDDLAAAYAPPAGALAFEENVLHLTVAPGAQPGAPAQVSSAPWQLDGNASAACAPDVAPRFELAVRTAPAGAPDTVDVERTRLGCTRVSGDIAVDAKPDLLDVALPFPSAYAYLALRAALAGHGTSAAPPAAGASALHLAAVPPQAQPVWSHDSVPLRDTLARMWQPSDNLVAEMLEREVGRAAAGAPGTREAGLAFERGWLARLGIAPATVTLADGSGLSSYDRLTPRALAAVLRRLWDGPQRTLVLDALPLAGVRGTLADAFAGTPAQGRVFAKTGSMSHVDGLAGYVVTQRRGTLIFAFLVDDFMGERAALRALRARVLARLVTA